LQLPSNRAKDKAAQRICFVFNMADTRNDLNELYFHFSNGGAILNRFGEHQKAGK
jgi:hypothetical protein